MLWIVEIKTKYIWFPQIVIACFSICRTGFSFWPNPGTEWAWQDIGRLLGRPVSVKASITTTITVVFNYGQLIVTFFFFENRPRWREPREHYCLPLINCHLWIKYFGREHEYVVESFLELRDLVSLILRNYRHTFHLKAYEFIYMSEAILDMFQYVSNGVYTLSFIRHPG